MLGLFLNELRGSIPATIGLLTSLEVMSFRNNRFTGIVPTTLGLLTDLRDLDLDYIPTLDSKKPTFCRKILHDNMHSLTHTYIHLSLEGAPLFTEIGSLTKLEYLAAVESYLAGVIPNEIGGYCRYTRSSFLVVSAFKLI